MLRTTSPPSNDPPVPLAALKAHLREEEDDTTNDATIAALAIVALGLIEVDVQRHYARREAQWIVADWRKLRRLPVAGVTSIERIEYADAAGELRILDPASYVLGWCGQGRAIRPAGGASWPAIGAGAAEPVVVTFKSGGALPVLVQHAVKLLVGHLYDNREAVVSNAASMGELPMGVELLLWTERWS